MIIYHWTGEYRPPELGEWYMQHHTLMPMKHSHPIDTTSRWILRREELPNTGDMETKETPHEKRERQLAEYDPIAEQEAKDQRREDEREEDHAD